MKVASVLPLATLCVAGFMIVESIGAITDEEKLLVQQVENIANTASELLLHSNDFHYSHSNIRHIRSLSEDIQKQFKDFSERVAKVPDQIGSQLKKFFEERGLSVERIQSILKTIAEAVERLVDEVRKAMTSDGKAPAAGGE
ncbi:unnamed protein product [Orchesella dallaii]|uniref:Uncharacterized protein n=1 Tax=Orchesella dallaii TaxID=48710 RepID=A0ABP1S6C1_9HEXA